LAHRFNSVANRKEPKPSARERTWYRWRLKHDHETVKDKERFKAHIQTKERIKESILRMLGIIR